MAKPSLPVKTDKNQTIVLNLEPHQIHFEVKQNLSTTFKRNKVNPKLENAMNIWWESQSNS